MTARISRFLMLILFATVTLSACSREMSSPGLDDAAKALVSEIEKLVTPGTPMTVAAIGFGEEGKKGTSDEATRVENRINHYIAQSPKLKLIEVQDDEIRKIMEMIAKQSDLKYKEPIFIDFTNLRNIITGSIEKGENQTDIRVRLVSLENAEVLGSAVATVPLKLSSSAYLLRVLLVFAGLFVLLGLAKKVFLRSKKITQPKDFKKTTCSACGRKIEDRYQQAATCTEPTCDNPICTDCWNIKRVRKCNTHKEPTK
jgi:hypothetical protein